MDEFASIAPSVLRRDPECGFRAARVLAGSNGKAKLADARWAVEQRLRGDITLAHSELRVATEHNFSEPIDLLPEQRAVYRAAARGYLTLFADTPVRSVEITKQRFLPELQVRFVANPGIALEHADGTLELRTVRTSGRTPEIDGVAVHTAALLFGNDTGAPRRSIVRLVAADLLALDVSSLDVDPDHERPAAVEWVEQRLTRWQTVAEGGRVVAGSDCSSCTFIWDCPAHATARSS